MALLYPTNNTSITDYKESEKICSEYHNALIPEFVNTTKQNICKRVKETLYIINKNQYISCRDIHFNIDIDSFMTKSMTFITPIIQHNTLVHLSSCKTIPKSKSDYRKVARNRLNRNKPKFVGNFVFAPLLFDQLYQFCCKMFNDNGIIVFVSILSDILCPESIIKFQQTRPQPLIPYNTFVMKNDFKTSCIALLRHYKIEGEWNITNKKTAKEKWYCFIECLPKLSQRCSNHQFKSPSSLFRSKPRSFTTQTPIIPMDLLHKVDEKQQYNAYIDIPPSIDDEMVTDTNHNEYNINNNTYSYQHHAMQPDCNSFCDLGAIDTMQNDDFNNMNSDFNIMDEDDFIMSGNAFDPFPLYPFESVLSDTNHAMLSDIDKY